MMLSIHTCSALARVTTAALVLLMLAACAGGGPAVQLSEPVVYSTGATRTDFTAYQDPVEGYTVSLPREWFVGRLPDPQNGIVVASSQEPSAPRAAITILAEPISGTPELDRAIANAETTLSAGEGIAGFDLDIARPVTVNNVSGQERLYSYQFDQTEVRQRTFYFAREDRLYAVSYIAPHDLYAQYETLFADVIASWQVGA